MAHRKENPFINGGVRCKFVVLFSTKRFRSLDSDAWLWPLLFRRRCQQAQKPNLQDMRLKRQQISLIEGGRDRWEGTDQYKHEVGKIVRAVRTKYSQSLSNEKKSIKRFLIKVRMWIEIGNKIDGLSSSRNLHTYSGLAQWMV